MVASSESHSIAPACPLDLNTGILSQIETKLHDWPLGRQGPAATLKQQRPQMTQSRCKLALMS